jgi:hypothetical protein
MREGIADGASSSEPARSITSIAVPEFQKRAWPVLRLA